MRKHFGKLALIFSTIAAFIFLSFTKDKSHSASNTSKPEINFIENSFTDAVKQASAKHKYIFVDAYATWCGPCKMLRATTFKNDKVVQFFNENFVNVSIDVEKGQGPQLASAWGIQSIPALIICDSSGKPVYGSMGYINASSLIKFGQQGLSKK